MKRNIDVELRPCHCYKEFMRDRALKVLEGYAAGKNLQHLFEEHGISQTTFWNLRQKDQGIVEAYELAKEARSHLFESEVITIADNEVDSNRARNRIEARKWAASKINPRVFGDRIDMNVTGQVDITAALAAAQKRILRPACDLTPIANAQDVEFTAIEDHRTTDKETVGRADLPELDIFEA